MSWLRRDRDKTEHGYVAERLSAYLDGELTPQEQAAVEQHVAGCEACRWDLTTLRQTVQWTRELPSVPVPRVFTIPVEAQPERSAPRRWRLVPALQGATAIVALLLFFVVTGDVVFRDAMPALAPAPAGMLEEQAVEFQATLVVQVERELEEPQVADTTVAEKAVSAPEAVPLHAEVAPTGAMLEAPAEAVDEAPTPADEELEAVASEPQEEAVGGGESGAPPEGVAEEPEAEIQAESLVPEAGEVVLTTTVSVAMTEGLMASPSAVAPTLRFGTERALATGAPEPSVIVVVSTPALSITVAVRGTVPAVPGTAPATTTPLATATVAQPAPTSTPVEPKPVTTEAPEAVSATEVAVAPTAVLQPTTAPTKIAEAPEAVGQVDQGWQQETVGSRQRAFIDPVRVLEVGLGLMLVLLAAATILLMVERRRA